MSEIEVDLRDVESRHSNKKLNNLIDLIRQGGVIGVRTSLDCPGETTVGNTKRYGMQLGLYRLSPDAILPTRATKHSACWDVYAIEDGMLSDAGSRNNFCVMRTGWRLVIPEGYRIDVKARSGMAAKQGVTVLNAPGTIDSDYEDELMIILGSVNRNNVWIEKGQRIAQIALERVQEFTVKELSEDELPVIDSDRTGGLGSTGS